MKLKQHKKDGLKFWECNFKFLNETFIEVCNLNLEQDPTKYLISQSEILCKTISIFPQHIFEAILKAFNLKMNK